MLATGGTDGWVILWDAATLKELRRVRDPTGEVYDAEASDVRFSADGRWVAARVGSFSAISSTARRRNTTCGRQRPAGISLYS